MKQNRITIALPIMTMLQLVKLLSNIVCNHQKNGKLINLLWYMVRCWPLERHYIIAYLYLGSICVYNALIYQYTILYKFYGLERI